MALLRILLMILNYWFQDCIIAYVEHPSYGIYVVRQIAYVHGRTRILSFLFSQE